MPPPDAPVQIVWLRRDLRVDDHDGLHQAARRGPVLPLYIVDPAWLAEPTFGTRHWTFVRECLADVDAALAGLGQPLRVRVGEPTAVLAALAGEIEGAVGGVWVTAERGRRARERDARAAAWAAARGVGWHAAPPDDSLARTPVARPSRLGGARTAAVPAGDLPTAAALGLAADGLTAAALGAGDDGWLSESGRRRVAGGTAAGMALLASFLAVRGRDYAGAADDPAAAPLVCSRIGAHLAWGALAPSAAHAALRAAERERARRHGHPPSADHAADDEAWHAALMRYAENLAARSGHHARFAARPDLEPAGAEDAPADAPAGGPGGGGVEGTDTAERLDAWAAGATGRPLVDAAMRQLAVIGWLPYRLRAVAASFAVHDLGLPWPSVGRRLARLSLDFDPAVHWPILRRIAGALDGSGPRVYNVGRQALALDPDGAYVRAWLPPLMDVPSSFVHSPWLMPAAMQAAARCRVGVDIPPPLATPRAGRGGPPPPSGPPDDGAPEAGPRQLPLGG